jgi:hypothetical protein
MSSSLSITKRLNAEHQWEIIASIVSGGTLPLDIFMYENTGDNTLGDYIGVCSLSEYQRLKTFEGGTIDKFANRFVKYAQAKIKLDVSDDTDKVVSNLTKTVKALSLEMVNSSPTTQIINIP